MGKTKVGIYGAAGYTAGELIRILLNHPKVEIVSAQSSSQANKPIHAIHTDLIGETDLVFSAELDFDEIDILFLCKGHGESKVFMEENESNLEAIKVIDLSHDFRTRTNTKGFIYGLPELNQNEIQKTNRIANPGCFATCIQLGLLPSAANDLIKGPINISGITGSTGAGQSLSSTSHFSWRNNNMSVYKPFTHQHLAEIKESLEAANNGFDENIFFIPYRGNFTRGIITTSYFQYAGDFDQAVNAYKNYYQSSPFVFVSNENPDLKQVVNTNKGIVYLKEFNDTLMVVSLIDNLLKGASGQAVQNMNISMGWDETDGLKLKATSF